MSKWDDVVKRLEDTANLEVAVGWFDSARYDDDTPVAYVAAIQEFGAPRAGIPPRPFLKPCISANEEMWAEKISKGMSAVIAGKITGDQVLDAVGGLAARQLQKQISEVSEPELSDVTLLLRKWRKEGKTITGKTVAEARDLVNKGEADVSGVPTDPLNDTGYMIATVQHLVRKKTT